MATYPVYYASGAGGGYGYGYDPAYATGSVTTSCVVWVNWNQEQTQTTSVTTSGVWYYWNQPDVICEPDTAPLRELYAERNAEQKKRNDAARERAEALLFLFLAPEQRAQYESQGYFETDVNDSRYRIHRGRAGNIQVVDKNTGKPVTKLCVHPVDYLPDADNVLAQYLALHADEKAVLKTANHTRLA